MLYLTIYYDKKWRRRECNATGWVDVFAVVWRITTNIAVGLKKKTFTILIPNIVLFDGYLYSQRNT